MNLSAWRNFGWQMRELQQIVRRRFRSSKEEPDITLPDADLSEEERDAAVEREAERREHEGE